MGERQAMAMFPLGMVLLPTMVVPIHVFEPRYRKMAGDCLAGDREFGVVLIERGSEVGGGDVRTDVGTVARIIEAQEFPDGRWGPYRRRRPPGSSAPLAERRPVSPSRGPRLARRAPQR